MQVRAASGKRTRIDCFQEFSIWFRRDAPRLDAFPNATVGAVGALAVSGESDAATASGASGALGAPWAAGASWESGASDAATPPFSGRKGLTDTSSSPRSAVAGISAQP